MYKLESIDFVFIFSWRIFSLTWTECTFAYILFSDVARISIGLGGWEGSEHFLLSLVYVILKLQETPCTVGECNRDSKWAISYVFKLINKKLNFGPKPKIKLNTKFISG